MPHHPRPRPWASSVVRRFDRCKSAPATQPPCPVTCVTGGTPRSRRRGGLGSSSVSSERPSSGNPFSPYGAPAPLVAAAGLVFVQGLLTTLYGIGELFTVSSSRVIMGLTTAVFFVAYGLGQMLCAWGMTR